MRNRLFQFSRNHSSLTIEEEDEQIIFIESSCFDYNTGEWDTYFAKVPRTDFIKGAEEFLEKGKCEVGELRIGQSLSGGIFISVGEGDIYITEYPKSKVAWYIVDEVDVRYFREGLAKTIKQKEPTSS